MHSYTSYAIDDLRLLAITKQFTKNITLTSITSTLRTHKVNLRILHTHTLRTYTHYETYTQNARTHTYIGCAHIGSWDICSYSPDINTLKRKNWTCWHDIPPTPRKNLLWAERGKPRSLEQKGMAVSSDEGRTKTYHQSPETRTTYWWESTIYKEHTYLHWKQKLEKKGPSGKVTPLRAPHASSAWERKRWEYVRRKCLEHSWVFSFHQSSSELLFWVVLPSTSQKLNKNKDRKPLCGCNCNSVRLGTQLKLLHALKLIP